MFRVRILFLFEDSLFRVRVIVLLGNSLFQISFVIVFENFRLHVKKRNYLRYKNYFSKGSLMPFNLIMVMCSSCQNFEDMLAFLN